MATRQEINFLGIFVETFNVEHFVELFFMNDSCSVPQCLDWKLNCIKLAVVLILQITLLDYYC